jgi:Condensation domain
MSDTAARLAGLTPERRRLLELLLRQADTAAPRLAIPRRGDGGPAPLSFAQQRLWFLHQLEPRNPAFNTPAAVRLRGALKTEALRRTLDEIVRRHEALRTRFVTAGGQTRQIVSGVQPLALRRVDLTGLPEAEREQEALRLTALGAAEPFDLEAGPPVRATLFSLGPEDHVALFVMHHIVSDGWSMGVLIREVAALYEAFSEGRNSPLEELPIQYADYAAWQREQLTGEALDAQLGYWKRQLGGRLPELELPTDRPRPTVPTYDGATASFTLPEELTASLRALCRREGVTLYTLLLAAFQTLLHRYTGQEDITVGSPVAGRDRAETEGLIGCFINTLVLRTDLSGNPPFAELLGRVREVVLGAFANQQAPFEKVVEAVRPDRATGRQRLFRVWFVVQNAPLEPLKVSGLTLSDMKIERTAAQFDLALSIFETGARIAGTLDYNSGLFDADTAAEMLERFGALLEGLTADPAATLLDIPLGLGDGDGARAPSAAAPEEEEQFAL